MKYFSALAVGLAILGAAAFPVHAQQTPTTPAPTPGALGTYYNNQVNSAIPPAPNLGSPTQPASTILTLVTQQVDPSVNFPDTQSTNPPAQADDWFNITWVGTITAPLSGAYFFEIEVDDGGRLWVSKTLPFAAASNTDPNGWKDQGATNYDYPLNTQPGLALTAGDVLNFRFEYYEHGGGTRSILKWKTPGTAGNFVAIPAYTAAGGGLQTPGPCPTPVLTATSIGGAAQILLNWTIPALTAGQTQPDSYNIYRGTGAGVLPRTLIGNTTGLTFTDTGAIGGPLTFGTTYYYVVQGVYSSGTTTTGPYAEVCGNPSNEAPCAVNPFAISPLSLLVIENGGVGTITITTSAAIPAGVTVSFPVAVNTVGGGASFTVASPAVMTGNNTVGQSINIPVTGVDNQIASDPKTANIVFGPSSSANAGFNGHTLPPVVCTQIESDIAGVIITPATGLAITNGGPAITFNVKLATIPQGAGVTVNMTTNSTIPYAAVITPPTLTFDATNWNTGFTITVTPNNVDTNIFYLTSFYVDFTPVTSTDVNYNGINPGRAYIFEATSTPPLQDVWGGGGGGGGGCGLTGLEGLAALALVRIWRRRRR